MSKIFVPNFCTVNEENFNFVPYAQKKDCFEIISPLFDGFEISVNGKSLAVNKTDLLVISPQVFTEFVNFPCGGEYVSLCFSHELVRNAVKKPLQMFTYRLFSAEEKSARELFCNLQEEIKECENKQAEELLLNSAALKILSAVMNREKDCVGRGKNFAVLEILKYINENCFVHSEEETAEHFCVSYSYFSRTFKSAVKMSFIEYVTFLRINKAKQLLLETDRDIGTLSRELNFSSASHFVNVFRSKTGATPKKFRDGIKGKNE